MVIGGLQLQSYLRDEQISAAKFARMVNTTERMLRRAMTGRRPIAERVAVAIERETSGRVTVPMWRIARKYKERTRGNKET